MHVIDLIANNSSLHVSFLHLIMFNQNIITIILPVKMTRFSLVTYTGLLQSFSLLKLAPASLHSSLLFYFSIIRYTQMYVTIWKISGATLFNRDFKLL